MAWRRFGCLFRPDGRLAWMRSHAALPTPAPLGDDVFRVFFSARDAANRSSVGSALVELGEPPRLLAVDDRPVLQPGPTGAHDDAGLGVGSIALGAPGGDRLYYMGWNVGGAVPWRNAIGLAIGDVRSGRFERYAVGPILDRAPEDPFTLSYPWALPWPDGGWYVWYGTNTRWGADTSDMFHVIRRARSADGITDWRRDRDPTVEPSGDEIAVVRPSVVRDGALWRLWFARRRDHYSIGSLESDDGIAWRRGPAALDLGPSDAPWENQAVTYPAVIRHRDRLWLFYNGNGYGESGFGVAVLDDTPTA
jgi:hypothetical protein